MSVTEAANLITITVNGQVINIPKGTTVYQAARQLDIDIPVFCYQDRMPPFGACRVCLVEVEGMPKLQASCTLEATSGMVVKTQTEKAVEGREGILELLLINHPLDCPICDRGGECPLQDQAFKHGPGESRFFEEKRKFKKPIPLGPVLMLDRERCIQCARCTRFSAEVSGDHALEFIDRGYKMEVGTPGGGPAKSKFIGNTISICPVGALTSQAYRFRARPWDNASTSSTCTLCPVGCSLTIDSRDGQIMRTRARENKAVNDIWMCDKGWFGYEFVYHGERLTAPLIRRGDRFEKISWEEAIAVIADKLLTYKSSGKIAALGGNPLTVEENYLWQQLMRLGAGTEHVDHRVGMPILGHEESFINGMEISLGDVEALSYVVLCGIDITEELPVLWLRLKQAINCGAKVIFIGHYAPEVGSQLNQVILHPPGEELNQLQQQQALIAQLAQSGKKGALFVGRQYLAHPNRQAILSHLEQLKQTTTNLSLNILDASENSYGAAFAEMQPTQGMNVLEVLEKASQESWDLFYVAGANPVMKYPSALWQAVRKNLKFLVVQDLFMTETAQQADLVLPTLGYVEKSGSFINIEGRIQKLQPGKEIPEAIYSDGEIFQMIGAKLGLNLALDAIFVNSLSKEKVEQKRKPIDQNVSQVSCAKSEGELWAVFAPKLFDLGVRMRHDPHLVQLAEAPYIRLHPQEAVALGIQNEDQVRVSRNGASIQGRVQLDTGLARGVVVLPLGFPELPVQELSANLLNGLAVRVEVCE